MTTWGYGPASRLTSLSHNLSGTAQDVSFAYSYTPLSQIKSITRDNDLYAWNGGVAVNRSYTANGLNQYSQSGGTALSYDGKGNLIQSGSAVYAYSQLNALAGNASLYMFYDPLGRRDYISPNGSAPAQWFEYSGNALVGESDGLVMTRRFVWGPGTDEPLVWYEGGNTADRRWYYADERGSIIAIADAAGNALATTGYDEYGIPSVNLPVAQRDLLNKARFGYTGQQWLPEFGMYDYKARIYSASMGRFLQTDPIGFAGGINVYGYVGGDPVNFTDPFGLRATFVERYHFRYRADPPSSDGGIEVTAPCSGGPFFTYYSKRTKTCHYEVPSEIGGPSGRPNGEGGGGSGGGGNDTPQEDAPKDDPKCALALSQSGEIAFEATTGTLIVGGGITLSRGTFINLRTGTTGSFFSLGGGGGADIGVAEVVGTASSLGLLNKGGASASVSAGIATFSANGSLGKGGITPAGKSAGLGAGTLKLGASLTMSGTRLYGCKVQGQ